MPLRVRVLLHCFGTTWGSSLTASCATPSDNSLLQRRHTLSKDVDVEQDSSSSLAATVYVALPEWEACKAGFDITSLQECQAAIATLGIPGTDEMLTDHWSLFPRFCSVKLKADQYGPVGARYNTGGPVGSTFQEFRCVCRAPTTPTATTTIDPTIAERYEALPIMHTCDDGTEITGLAECQAAVVGLLPDFADFRTGDWPNLPRFCSVLPASKEYGFAGGQFNTGGKPNGYALGVRPVCQKISTQTTTTSIEGSNFVPSAIPWPTGGVRGREPPLQFDDDFQCSPAVGDEKSERCSNRGSFVSLEQDIGFTLGVRGQPGCLQMKIGTQEQPLSDGQMPREAYALTQANRCQRFRLMQALWYVARHTPSGVIGFSYTALSEARAAFQNFRGGKYATILMTRPYTRIDMYGYDASHVIDDFKAWLRRRPNVLPTGEVRQSPSASLLATHSGNCSDTPGWTNQYGYGCVGDKSYESEGWCSGGSAAQGKDWSLGSEYDYAEQNCCICGKVAASVSDAQQMEYYVAWRSPSVSEVYGESFAEESDALAAFQAKTGGTETTILMTRQDDGLKALQFYRAAGQNMAVMDLFDAWLAEQQRAEPAHQDYWIMAVDALGRKIGQFGVGLLGLTAASGETPLVGDDVLRDFGGQIGEAVHFSMEVSDSGVPAYSHASNDSEVVLEVLDGASGRNQVGYCSKCDYPFYGRYCQKWRQNPTNPIDVLVVVLDPTTGGALEGLADKLTQYQSDLREYEGKVSDVLVWDLPRMASLRPERELRQLIKSEYVHRKIRSVFLIGDFPAAFIDLNSQTFAWKGATAPSLAYFSQFSGRQQFPAPDCGFLHKQNPLDEVYQDISIGIINQADVHVYRQYFDRLHQHRVTGSAHPVQKQWSYNEGDWWCDEPWPLYSDFTFNNTNGNYCYQGPTPQNSLAYAEMANNKEVRYEYYHARAHSMHNWLGVGGHYTELWGLPFSGISFFNLFHCSSAHFTDSNLAATFALASQHGLAAVGSSHTGAMLSNPVFETHLMQGKSWGESIRRWYNSHGRNTRSWHQGITGYGDPEVRMRDSPGWYGASLMQTQEEADAEVDNEEMVEETEEQREMRERLEALFAQDAAAEQEHEAGVANFEEYLEQRDQLTEYAVEADEEHLKFR